jgi:hypothetical protein
MPEQFSPETKELLDRAQCAMDEAVTLRRLSRSQVKDAKNQTAMLQLETHRDWAQQYQSKG